MMVRGTDYCLLATVLSMLTHLGDSCECHTPGTASLRHNLLKVQ